MFQTLSSDGRGRTELDWLDSRHSFSFGHYHDPARMGFGPLRVINEDWIAAGRGFPAHPHRDMEILTWVLEGQLQHRDDTGGGGVLVPGELQRMTAGRGIVHSEMNPSTERAVHLLQIWIQPRESGLDPSWDQRAFDLPIGRFRALAGPDGVEDSLQIAQDASLSVARIDGESILETRLDRSRIHWFQVTRGQVRAGDQTLKAGDALTARDEDALRLEATVDSEVLWFDLQR